MAKLQFVIVECICGHDLGHHWFSPNRKECIYAFCGCLDFKQDNLKYLEDRYKPNKKKRKRNEKTLHS